MDNKKLFITLVAPDNYLIEALVRYVENAKGAVNIDITETNDETGESNTRSVPLRELTDLKQGMILEMMRSQQFSGLLSFTVALPILEDGPEEPSDGVEN